MLSLITLLRYAAEIFNQKLEKNFDFISQNKIVFALIDGRRIMKPAE